MHKILKGAQTLKHYIKVNTILTLLPFNINFYLIKYDFCMYKEYLKCPQQIKKILNWSK